MVAYGRYFPNFKELIQMSLTFFLAVIGWIIFRAETISQAFGFLSAMINNRFFDKAWLLNGIRTLLLACFVLVAEWLQRDKQHALQVSNQTFFRYSIVRLIIYIILICVTYTAYMVNIQDDSLFIYFQF